MALGFFTDERCLEHHVPAGFPELPARLEALREGLQAAGLRIDMPGPHRHTPEAILAVHDAGYLQRFEMAVQRGDHFLDTGDNPLSSGTWRAAHAAVDVCLQAAEWMLGGADRQSIALVRPPGHHAERAMAMGFCYFNNVAVVAEYLVSRAEFERLAIVDFDVHHGNGTQHLFEQRADVLYASLHRHPFYPGTGLAHEQGVGDGEGATLNIPLAAGSDDEVYRRAFVEELLPALRGFRPDALLLSAGFDAARTDPVGGMQVTTDAFGQWGRWLQEVADEFCDGRLLATLEGGYDIAALSDQLLAFSRGLRRDSA